MVMEGFAAGGAGGSRCCLARDVDAAQWGKSGSLSARPSPGQTGSTYSGGEVAMVAALLVAIATTALVAKIRLTGRDGRVPTMGEYVSIPLPMPNKGSPYVDLSRASAALDDPRVHRFPSTPSARVRSCSFQRCTAVLPFSFSAPALRCAICASPVGPAPDHS